MTIGRSARDVLEETDKDGNTVVRKGLAALKKLKPYKVVFISNNVDYIEFLEEGSSKQAPNGMVAVTVEELRVWMKEQIK